jgi:hypothetical protein
MRPLMRRLLPALVLGAVALGAAGCNEYHYYDIKVAYDGAQFMPNNISMVQDCHVFVTGADTADFYLEGPCTSGVGSTNIGVFEFATFADSGTLNFTIRTFVGGIEFEDCLFGTGTKAIPATSAITTADDPSSTADDLIINMPHMPAASCI